MNKLNQFDESVVKDVEELEQFVAELISLGADPDAMVEYLFQVEEIIPWWSAYSKLTLGVPKERHLLS